MPPAQSTAATLQTALEQHQAGRLEEAAALYRDVLRLDPRHPDALHLLGVTLHQRNRHPAAIDSIRRAIAVKDNAPQYHANLGVALHAAGRLDEAIESFRQALRLDPVAANAHFNLAKTLEALGKPDEALSSYQQALEADPTLTAAWINLGRLYSSQRNYAEAEKQYRHALRLQPDSVPAHYNLGIALQEQGRLDESAAAYEEALRHSSETAEIHNNLGVVRKELRQFDEALACFRRAVELKFDSVQAHNNLGSVYQHQGDLEKAENCYRQALLLEPQFAGALTNLGNIHHDRGEMEAAVSCYSRAIDFRPDYPEAHFNRALARIRKGDFAAGWAEYEWRWRHKVPPRSFPQPVWDGTPLEFKTILAYSEQGIGDEVMFASCLPDLILRAGRVNVECDPRLVKLFARSFPETTVVAREADATGETNPETLSAAELQVALGSLPRFFRNAPEDFPRHSGYLVPDTGRLALWRERFAALGENLKVGISWQGGGDPDVRRARSTRLSQWQPLFEVTDVDWINLQYGDTDEERERLQSDAGILIHDWSDADPLADLEHFAAQIAALDLVISVDNATVHIAGALGKEVWTLLPAPADWRWQIDSERTLWYPSMRLFRQPACGAWDPTFHRAVAELSNRNVSEPAGVCF